MAPKGASAQRLGRHGDCRQYLRVKTAMRREPLNPSRGHLLIEQKPVNPIDDGSSPYLQRPRRSYEKAQRDREDRDRQLVAEDTKPVQSG